MATPVVKKGFGARLWKYIKWFWVVALWPIAQKIFDWFVGDATVNQVKNWAHQIHAPNPLLWIFQTFSKYPVRSSVVLMCLIVSTSAVVAVIKSEEEANDPNATPSPQPLSSKETKETELLDVLLTPSQGPSEKQFVGVKNKGKKQKFHATGWLVARRNDPNPLFQKTYDLAWENDSQKAVEISHGESRNLLIATAEADDKNHLEAAKLVELSEGSKKTVEWSRWNKYERHNPRPEYDLEISIHGEGDASPFTECFTLLCGGQVSALELVRTQAGNREQFPERGDYHRSMSSSRTNSDGSVSLEFTSARQIDHRPQLWEALANRFKELESEPAPIWAQWAYTFETKQYQWWVRHSSEVAVKMCIELCKQAGRLLLTESDFRRKFPDVAGVTDDGDRWLLGVYKIAGIGKVRGEGSHITYGVHTNSENGEISDLPGASRVLCQMALNGF